MNKAFVFILGAALFLGSCSDDEGVVPDTKGSDGWTNEQKALLYNKVWYSAAQGGGIDLEFLSDGTYRQAKSLEGTYTWLNDGDTMNIVDYSNSRFSYIFDKISASEMVFRTNLGGNNFQTPYTYRDTK